MNKLFEAGFISVFLIFGSSPVQAVPVYVGADFVGSVTGTPHFGTELGLQRSQDKDCNGCPEGAVWGHVLFDTSLTPETSSGIVNIPLTSITNASNNLIFSIYLGSAPLAFQFNDADIDNAPSIQFKDGIFNGFNFSETFFLGGDAFRFDIDGSAWDIRAANKNGIYSKLAASGTLNVGSSGLLNQQVFEPRGNELPSTGEPPASIPEPATLALLGLGLGMMAFISRKVRITSII